MGNTPKNDPQTCCAGLLACLGLSRNSTSASHLTTIVLRMMGHLSADQKLAESTARKRVQAIPEFSMTWKDMKKEQPITALKDYIIACGVDVVRFLHLAEPYAGYTVADLQALVTNVQPAGQGSQDVHEESTDAEEDSNAEDEPEPATERPAAQEPTEANVITANAAAAHERTPVATPQMPNPTLANPQTPYLLGPFSSGVPPTLGMNGILPANSQPFNADREQDREQDRRSRANSQSVDAEDWCDHQMNPETAPQRARKRARTSQSSAEVSGLSLPDSASSQEDPDTDLPAQLGHYDDDDLLVYGVTGLDSDPSLQLYGDI